MGETINWGIPNAGRTKKKEQFNTPVVTMSAIIKDGAGRKFSFNKAAQEVMGLNTSDGEIYVAFGFGDNIYVKSSTTLEQSSMKKLTKTFTFSDKKIFEFIVNREGLSTASENHLHLEEVDGEGMFKIISTTADVIEGDATRDEKVEIISTQEEVLNEVETVEETPPTMQDTYDLVDEQKAEEVGEVEEEVEIEVEDWN